jgi:hypothetical protein
MGLSNAIDNIACLSHILGLSNAIDKIACLSHKLGLSNPSLCDKHYNMLSIYQLGHTFYIMLVIIIIKDSLFEAYYLQMKIFVIYISK